MVVLPYMPAAVDIHYLSCNKTVFQKKYNDTGDVASITVLLQREFFYQDIVDLNITILDITADDVIRAETLILKRYMKPVDSIGQLSFHMVQMLALPRVELPCSDSVHVRFSTGSRLPQAASVETFCTHMACQRNPFITMDL